MAIRWQASFLPLLGWTLVASLQLVGCVDGEAGEGEGEGESEGCAGLCTGAGFDDGDEIDFGGGLVECTCAGTGDGIAEADCDLYCEAFDVGPDDALLSSEASANDKCVCDGTTP